MDVWFDIIPHILLDLIHIITCMNLLCEDREYILFFNSCGLVREYPFPDYDASNCWSIIWWVFFWFQENDDIPLDSYCRIEHVVSGSWLHACPGTTLSVLFLNVI